jgi:AcrR family transcriptional regulator
VSEVASGERPLVQAGAHRLPRGPHDIPRQEVVRNQRQRLIAAMADAVAERGYAETVVVDVIKRAGVSRGTFYEHFANRQDCMLSSFWPLFERLMEQIETAYEAESDPAVKFRAALRRALELLAEDPASTRLLTVEILAAGPQGAAGQHAAIERLASCLRAARKPGAGRSDRPADSDWASVALIVSLIARRLVAGEPERLPELEPEWSQIALAPYARAEGVRGMSTKT